MWLPLRLLLLLLLPLLAQCAEDYYKLLGVDKSASEKDLKKAYRTLSKKYHPDKNPNDETAKQKFAEVADAYEALSNNELRRIYDQYGHEGLERHKKTGGRQAQDPFDLFSRFFGGGGHFGQHGGQRKGQNTEVRVQIPLKDFYSGVETQFTIEKQGICETCEGSGSHDGKTETCGQCRGNGVVIQKHMLAPGIFQQVQTHCDACGGKGTVIKSPCKTCGGHRVVRKQETFDLSVDPGMPKGWRITYEGDGDESPDFVAGDLVVQLWERDAGSVAEADEVGLDGNFFRRKGNHLFWREVLGVREAWMGDWTRNVTHLDGRTIQLKRARGQVVQPGHVEVVKGEGMPEWHADSEMRHARAGYAGDLHVEYVVVLPDQMDKPMEKDFWATFEKWRAKKGVNLDTALGRKLNPPKPKQKGAKEEL